MPDQESDAGFTVVDRRRRGEDAQETRPSRETTSRAAPAPARPEVTSPPGAPPRPDFASFCVMLYSDALVHLGQVPDPATGQIHRDLDQAQFTIDLLGMLQQKTEGNRTPEESAVLDEMLSALRIGFVRATGLAQR